MGQRRYQRTKAVLPVRVFGLDADGVAFDEVVYTLDLSRGGALLAGIKARLTCGQTITLQHKKTRAAFRVAWIGEQRSRAGLIGVEAVDGQNTLWADAVPGEYKDEFAGKRRTPDKPPAPPPAPEQIAAPAPPPAAAPTPPPAPAPKPTATPAQAVAPVAPPVETKPQARAAEAPPPPARPQDLSADADQPLRRSSRVQFKTTVVVQSLDAPTPYEEQTESFVVNAHGCGVQSKTPLAKNTRVRLRVPAMSTSGDGRVVSCVALPGGLWALGIELDAAANLWGVRTPPEDWHTPPAPRAARPAPQAATPAPPPEAPEAPLPAPPEVAPAAAKPADNQRREPEPPRFAPIAVPRHPATVVPISGGAAAAMAPQFQGDEQPARGDREFSGISELLARKQTEIQEEMGRYREQLREHADQMLQRLDAFEQRLRPVVGQQGQTERTAVDAIGAASRLAQQEIAARLQQEVEKLRREARQAGSEVHQELRQRLIADMEGRHGAAFAAISRGTEELSDLYCKAQQFGSVLSSLCNEISAVAEARIGEARAEAEQRLAEAAERQLQLKLQAALERLNQQAAVAQTRIGTASSSFEQQVAAAQREVAGTSTTAEKQVAALIAEHQQRVQSLQDAACDKLTQNAQLVERQLSEAVDALVKKSERHVAAAQTKLDTAAMVFEQHATATQIALQSTIAGLEQQAAGAHRRLHTSVASAEQQLAAAAAAHLATAKDAQGDALRNITELAQRAATQLETGLSDRLQRLVSQSSDSETRLQTAAATLEHQLTAGIAIHQNALAEAHGAALRDISELGTATGASLEQARHDAVAEMQAVLSTNGAAEHQKLRETGAKFEKQLATAAAAHFQQFEQAYKAAAAKLGELQRSADGMVAQVDAELTKLSEHVIADANESFRAQLAQSAAAAIAGHTTRARQEADRAVSDLLARASEVRAQIDPMLGSLERHREWAERQSVSLQRQRDELKSWFAQETSRFQNVMHELSSDAAGELKDKARKAVDAALQPMQRSVQLIHEEFDRTLSQKLRQFRDDMEQSLARAVAQQRDTGKSVATEMSGVASSALEAFREELSASVDQSMRRWQGALRDALTSASDLFRTKLEDKQEP